MALGKNDGARTSALDSADRRRRSPLSLHAFSFGWRTGPAHIEAPLSHWVTRNGHRIIFDAHRCVRCNSLSAMHLNARWPWDGGRSQDLYLDANRSFAPVRFEVRSRNEDRKTVFRCDMQFEDDAVLGLAPQSWRTTVYHPDGRIRSEHSNHVTKFAINTEIADSTFTESLTWEMVSTG